MTDYRDGMDKRDHLALLVSQVLLVLRDKLGLLGSLAYLGETVVLVNVGFLVLPVDRV